METRQIRHTVEGRTFRILWIGDTHIGTIHCEEDRLCRDIAIAQADPEMRVILIGDLTDCINISDKRFDPACIKPSYMLKDIAKLAQIQTSDAVVTFRPIAKQVDYFLRGNHEELILKKYHYDVMEHFQIGMELTTDQYLVDMGIVRYHVES